MSFPFKKIGTIALQAAGVAVGNKTEKRENEILEEILAQQQLTNAILLENYEIKHGVLALNRFMKRVEKGS